MAAIATQPIQMTSKVIQATTNQDIAINGIAQDNSFQFIIVADNHGRGIHKFYTKNIINNIDWTTFLLQDNWKQKLIEMTSNYEKTYKIGSTFTLIKIFPDKFEIDWIGDSSAKIYDENTLIWQTINHDNQNNREILRLCNNNFQVIDRWGIKTINPTTIKNIKAPIFKKNNNCVNMTRTLGHQGIFIDESFHFDNVIIPREQNKKYKCIVATDGLWDLTCDEDNIFLRDMNNNADEIAQFAFKRWHQEWNHDNLSGNILKAKFPENNIDDIGVSVWMN